MRCTNFILILLMLVFSGCTTTRLTMGEAQIDSTYFLQKKDIKVVEYTAPDGSMLRMEAFGSDTSQIVSEAIKAGLGVAR